MVQASYTYHVNLYDIIITWVRGEYRGITRTYFMTINIIDLLNVTNYTCLSKWTAVQSLFSCFHISSGLYSTCVLQHPANPCSILLQRDEPEKGLFISQAFPWSKSSCSKTTAFWFPSHLPCECDASLAGNIFKVVLNHVKCKQLLKFVKSIALSKYPEASLYTVNRMGF